MCFLTTCLLLVCDLPVDYALFAVVVDCCCYVAMLLICLDIEDDVVYCDSVMLLLLLFFPTSLCGVLIALAHGHPPLTHSCFCCYCHCVLVVVVVVVVVVVFIFGIVFLVLCSWYCVLVTVLLLLHACFCVLGVVCLVLHSCYLFLVFLGIVFFLVCPSYLSESQRGQRERVRKTSTVANSKQQQ